MQTVSEKTANGLEFSCYGLTQIGIFCRRFKGRVHQQTSTMKWIGQRAIQHLSKKICNGHSCVRQNLKAADAITNAALQIVLKGPAIETADRKSTRLNYSH